MDRHTAASPCSTATAWRGSAAASVPNAAICPALRSNARLSVFICRQLLDLAGPGRRLSLAEVEDVLFLRLLHALFGVLLPHLRPRAAEHVRYFVFDDLPRRDGGSLALHRVKAGNAVDVLHRVTGVEPSESRIVAHDADGIDERLRVVEHSLVVERRDLAFGIADRCVDLHRLHLAGELEGAVCRPALDVGSPGDQYILVPEADRLAVPARDV